MAARIFLVEMSRYLNGEIDLNKSLYATSCFLATIISVVVMFRLIESIEKPRYGFKELLYSQFYVSSLTFSVYVAMYCSMEFIKVVF